MQQLSISFCYVVPKQCNALDCGVYICKYALALYQSRYLTITYEDVYKVVPPLQIISKSSTFDFTSHAISQLRGNMKKLLSNLFTLHLSIKNKQHRTPSQPKETLHPLPTHEKMELAAKFVGMYCQEITHPKIPEWTQVTQLTVTSTATTNLSQSKICLKTAKDAVVDAMRLQFYKIYGPIYKKAVIGGSSLPTKVKYDQVVESLQLYSTTIKKDQFMKNAHNRYALKTNVKDDNLFRKVRDKEIGEVSLRKGIWYERVLDIIHEVHLSLGHAGYSRTHKLLMKVGGDYLRQLLRFILARALNVKVQPKCPLVNP